MVARDLFVVACLVRMIKLNREYRNGQDCFLQCGFGPVGAEEREVARRSELLILLHCGT